ncbi:hypothetical protein [Draconibacterium sp.]|uniref:hypothetical protein n=1 Tax=Draconibacterium sp. TaxID=1965318 RepID=UPI0035688014
MLLSSLFFFIFTPQFSSAQSTISSGQNGSWSLESTWQPDSIPNENDNVIIDHEITIQAGTTVEVNDLVIDQKGVLTVEGTLILTGNLTMVNNDPEFITGSEAKIIIHGNANISNKVNINLSSYFIVQGNFTIDGGGAADINITNASIYVFGTFDGGSTSLGICSNYDNNTDNYSTETCHVGTEEAFNTNEENGLIPVDIVDLVLDCNASATISGAATSVCEGDDVVFTLTGTDGATVTYSFDGGSTTNDIVLTGGEVTITVSGATSDVTLTLVSINDGDCSIDISDSKTVQVNRFSLIVSDVLSGISGSHCPEFLPPFNASGGAAYNPGCTEVQFKVLKDLSTTSAFTFDFAIDESGDVEVYDLVSVVAEDNSTINYSGDDAGGSIDAGLHTEVTFTFHIKNVPGSQLDVQFSVSNGNDGECNETAGTTDNSATHVIDEMPVVGDFN